MEENNQNPSISNTPPVQASPTEQIPAAPPPPTKPKFKLTILISVIIFLIVIGTVSAAYLFLNDSNKQKACTMEAKICPDGSTVGRTGPNCEFSPCPSSQAPQGKPTDSTANWKTYNATNVYNLSYPLDKYSIRSGAANLNALWPGPIIIDPNDSFSQGDRITIIVYNNIDNLSLTNPKGLFTDSAISRCVNEAINGREIKQTVLDGQKAFEMDSCSSGLIGTKRQIISVHNNNVFSFIVEGSSQSEEINNLGAQILSSFKFSK